MQPQTKECQPLLKTRRHRAGLLLKPHMVLLIGCKMYPTTQQCLALSGEVLKPLTRKTKLMQGEETIA